MNQCIPSLKRRPELEKDKKKGNGVENEGKRVALKNISIPGEMQEKQLLRRKIYNKLKKLETKLHFLIFIPKSPPTPPYNRR